MAEGGTTSEGKQGAAEVHIVHVLKENDVEPEVHHVRTLASVLGSEEAARESLIYSYKTAISGFSAKLTPQQVDEISIPNYAVPSYTIPTDINIVMLNDTNFNTWKEGIMLFLGFMDLDIALRVDRPTSSHEDKRDTEKWDRSNRLSLMIMKHAISEALLGNVCDKITVAKLFLDELEKSLAENNEANLTMVLSKLSSMKYIGKGNIRKHILEMSCLASKLITLKFKLSEDVLVHLVLCSLPAQFSQLRVSYNCRGDKWTLNELISYCVEEEERQKQERKESAHLAATSKDKRPNAKEGKESSCFFCQRAGHLKKDCTKYHAWRAKKGLPPLYEAS